MASKPENQPQTIDLASLPTAQLTSLKNQLTQDLQHLTTSFQQLRAAQTKFRDCINSIRNGVENGEEGTPALCLGAWWSRMLTERPLSPTSKKDYTVSGGRGKQVLVPLTPSLYVPGKLASTDTVLVDVGTGFYVEKTPQAARQFYSSKVEELGKNLHDLEAVVQQKNGNLRIVEDVLRTKVISENSASSNNDERAIESAAG